MMRTFASIIGMILLIPLALVLVALAIITLIGGYIGVIVTLLGDILWIILAIAAIITTVVIVMKILNR